MEGNDNVKSDVRFLGGYPTNFILNNNLEFWMSQLPEPLKNIPIIHLAIPGSHNTMSYTIDRRNPVGPDACAFVRTLGRYCSILSKPIIFNWSVTQKDNIKTQLDSGIRYLDLRVATKGTGDIYFLHGLYGSEITKPLEDVANWLNGHANEIIILDFQHFYTFTEMNHRHLIAKINQLFRGKLCPVSSSFDRMSLRWLNSEKYQVFVIYRNIYAINQANLWPSGLWPTPWPNTVRVDQLVNFLNEELKKRVQSMGYVSQCILTPTTTYVMKHLCGTLQSNLVPLCQKQILSWIDQKKAGPKGLNIVIADFICDQNYVFPKAVIQANLRFLKDLQMS